MPRRRMVRRIMFFSATFIALAALIFWPISNFSDDRLSIPLSRGHRIILGSVDGGFQFYLSIAEGVRIHRPFSWTHQPPREYTAQPMSGFPGMRWRAFNPINISSNHDVPIITTGYMLRLSYWLILLLALPIAYIARPRRQEAGLCPSCGYDLRATPERCPECGAVPVTAK